MRYLYQTKTTSMSTLVKILVILILNNTTLFAQEEKAVTLTVQIENLDNNNGQILVGLYNAEDHFLNTTYKKIIGDINHKKSLVTFNNVPLGTYAVSIVHDENKNRKMDKNFIGIPTEDYGCSNGAKGFMGPPKWKDAKFELGDQDHTIIISL